MAVRTKRLASTRLTGTSVVDIYTTPDGETTILKSVAAQNINGSTATVLVLLMDVEGIGQTTLQRIALGALESVYLDRWIVIPPGGKVSGQLTVAVGVNLWLSGTELEGVAD
jgi:hypothetical protein